MTISSWHILTQT